MRVVVEPTLASTIYSTLTSDTTKQEDRRRVLTGCAAIDEALGTGLAYGVGGICCISGDEGSGVEEVSLSFLFLFLLLSSGREKTWYMSRKGCFKHFDRSATIV